METFAAIIAIASALLSLAFSIIGVYYGMTDRFDRAAYYLAFAILLEI